MLHVEAQTSCKKTNLFFVIFPDYLAPVYQITLHELVMKICQIGGATLVSASPSLSALVA